MAIVEAPHMHKKFSDYLNELPSDQLSSLLERKYNFLREGLELNALKELMEILEERGPSLGLPQYYGKMRAVLFEEYVFLYILKHLRGEFRAQWRPRLQLLKEFEVRPDICVFKGNEVCAIIECKVELDASRLKVALGDYLILSRLLNLKNFILVYYKVELSKGLLDLGRSLITGIMPIDEFVKQRVLQKLLLH